VLKPRVMRRLRLRHVRLLIRPLPAH
jgi:hypothetical protein